MSTQPAVRPLCVISPVRDESRYLRLTLDSMVAQTVRPAEWILVDDGSKDATPDIIAEYSAQHPWIRLVRREDRGFRQVGPGVVVAFEYGRERIVLKDWQYIAKLDGDMSFGPRYLEHMFEKLDADPRLAAVSGKVFRPEGRGQVEEYMIDDMVAGQFKLYRRAAFEDIGGFRRTVLWDAIDFHSCRMKGWHTLSFHHPDVQLLHHRLMGSSDKSVYRGRMRQGGGNWYVGYHWLYAIASGFFRMREKPYVIGGALMTWAYFLGMIKRVPQYEDVVFRAGLQAWQLEQLRALPGRWLRRLLRRP